MSGFDTIVSFTFSFLFVMTLIISSFYIFTQQVELQRELGAEEVSNLQAQHEDYEITSLFYMSGRTYLTLTSSGTFPLTFEDRNEICFEAFEDEKYFTSNEMKVLVQGDLASHYSLIEKGNSGNLVLIGDSQDLENDETYTTVSCNGNKEVFVRETGKENWWDPSFHERTSIFVQNNANISVPDYQIELSLNSSVFDFSNYLEKEIRFVLPYTDYLVLDLPFDIYNQTLQDYSNFSQTVVLGTSSASESSDPTENQESVLFSGLTFDGSDDSVLISSDDSLLLDAEITIAAWIKWNENGDTTQYIFVNGAPSTALGIVNDGGANTGKIFLNINSSSGSTQTLYSSSALDNNWHFIAGTYDGENLSIYLDGTLSNTLNARGTIEANIGSSYIGSYAGTSLFNGSLDEIRIFSTALDASEIKLLSYDALHFKELEYYVQDWDPSSEKGTIFVKLPSLIRNKNHQIEMYFDYREEIESHSDIETTFSYDVPRKIGYVVSDRIADTTDLNILSLYNSNSIIVGDDSFTYNILEGTTLSAANIDTSDVVMTTKLAQIEGAGDGDDMIVPMAFAGFNFSYRGFRAGTDRWCLLSPWGTANYILSDGAVPVSSGTVDESGTCFDAAIATNDALNLVSDLPILVHYTGGQDSFPLYPATNESLYGVPSQTMYIAAGLYGASVNWYDSSGGTSSASLGIYGTTKDGGNGADGGGPAFRVDSDLPIGVLQEADGDGSEATTFLPEKEFGVRFGSLDATDYIAIASNVNDANCSVYDSSLTLIGNQASATEGANDVYKYDFGTGDDNEYVTDNWMIVCEKPVYAYYENRNDNGDETNLFGHLQMRQIVYPSPSVVFE